MRKVQTGDPLVIPAQAYNAFIDTALDFRGRQQNQQRGKHVGVGQLSGAGGGGGAILVRNDSGQDVDRFGVLGIDGPIIDPAENLTEFKNHVALSCVTPVEGVHDSRFVILAEPLASGSMGRAYVGGVCPVRINITDAAHKSATIIDDDATQLISSDTGTTPILWKADGTGTQWAIVRLDAPPPSAGLMQLRVKQVGNTDDWLRCRTWDGTTEGAQDIYVARPYTLRRTPYDGQTIDGMTYSFAVVGPDNILQRRIDFADDTFEQQRIIPPYRVNDILYAAPAQTLVTVSGSPVTLLDINCDGRAWAEEDIYL